MSSEILGVFIQVEFAIEGAHRVFEWVEIVPRFGLALLEVLHPDEEIAKSSLLKQAHEVT